MVKTAREELLQRRLVTPMLLSDAELVERIGGEVNSIKLLTQKRYVLRVQPVCNVLLTGNYLMLRRFTQILDVARSLMLMEGSLTRKQAALPQSTLYYWRLW